ncbi:unnamed protein product [Didymodactylos carnosus]|uniref:Integral membrane bound transporter domain-containing protein n=1 Tax=Didymodactylos carnosus TaxID=1234261 RepID=A0A814B921_9BILA|nr:unnamed protein product [Didymodactylos carnosus]CAF3704553.1 unnamed protein product [Didymodactylos carnosus]
MYHPLIPSFPAKLIMVLRSLIAIGCCAAFTLTPRTSKSLYGELLIGVTIISSLQFTIGATIQSATRLFIAGALATVYCLFIINVLPRTTFNAVGATTLLVLLIVYTDLPIQIRRFTIVATCIVLLQWYNPKKPINNSFVLQIWASLSIGCGMAICTSLIPLPVPATANRELSTRLLYVAKQIRHELTTILLSINHINTSSSDSSFSSMYSSVENIPLLKVDINDLHTIVKDELPHMQRTLTELKWEPYYILSSICSILFCKCRKQQQISLELRMKTWVSGFVSLHRTISGMLALDYLDHHHYTFPPSLIESISTLIDTTFNFLDATLPYTATINYFKNTCDERRIKECRAELDQALERFCQNYDKQLRLISQDNPSDSSLIQMNTFLLLILRLVYVIISSAELTNTPGAKVLIDDKSDDVKKEKCCTIVNIKKQFENIINYIGLKPSTGKMLRAVKTSFAVLCTAVITIALRNRLNAYGWVHWAPMTTALIAETSEGGALRTSYHRLMGVLLGSTYAYIIVIVTQDLIAIGILISLFVGLMFYVRCEADKAYFANVCAQSASVITFISSNNGGPQSQKAPLARTSLTFIGIFIYILVSNLVLPRTARSLTKKRLAKMIKTVCDALKFTTDEFCAFVENAASNEQEQKFDIMLSLTTTEKQLETFPSLLREANNEPDLWRISFNQLSGHYAEIGRSLQIVVSCIRYIHRCTTILKAESNLIKVKQRRMSLQQIQNKHIQAVGLDIPLTIFGSSAEQTGITDLVVSYKPVLVYIRQLDQNVELVLQLAHRSLKHHTASLQFNQDTKEPAEIEPLESDKINHHFKRFASKLPDAPKNLFT